MFHEYGQVERIENERGGVLIHGKLPGRLIARYMPFSHVQTSATDTGANPDLFPEDGAEAGFQELEDEYWEE